MIKRYGAFILLFILITALPACFGPKSPLGRAVADDNEQEVQRLLTQGADPCEKVGEFTAFDWAQGDNREWLQSDAIKTKIYKILLDKAYERYTAGHPCENIIFYAARLGDGEKIRRLIAKGENPNIGQEFWESSPLGIAAYYGNKDAVSALVEGGADIDKQIENMDKTRSWATTIGKSSTYDRANQALKLLRSFKDKQGDNRRKAP